MVEHIWRDDKYRGPYCEVCGLPETASEQRSNCHGTPAFTTEVINDLGPAARQLKSLGWHTIHDAPHDRLIIVGWHGEMSGAFHIARVKWSEPPLSIKPGWYQFDTEGLGTAMLWPNLPKYWHEDVLGGPTGL